MEIKKLLNKVKDKHNELKNKIKQAKQPVINMAPLNKKPLKNFDEFKSKDFVKKGLELKNDIFIPGQILSDLPEQKDYKVETGDSLESIALRFYEDRSKWIMIHLANINNIPHPDQLITGILLKIPEEGTFDNFYPKSSKSGNYIIQPGDTGLTIAKNVFGSEVMLNKLVDWGFFKNKKDIYPGKEIEGLKYYNLKQQLFDLSNKFNLYIQEDEIFPEVQMKIILTAIACTARIIKVPPVVAMSVSSSEIYWMNSQGTSEKNNLDKNFHNWPPMQFNDNFYKDAFPDAAMNIEMNIHYGINVLKNLRRVHKTWPKAIVAYFIDSLPGIGKPSEQKLKAGSGIKVLNEIIKKLEKKEFVKSLKAQLKPEDDHDISCEQLHKELIKYRNFIDEKYLI